MPANLPPQFLEVERKLKTAKSAQEKITIMEELLSIIPKHKGTEKLQALYKTKIAKLKAQAQKKPAAARHSPSFHIDKAGAGQVILIGPPNTGKSSLIKALTNSEPDVGDYPFTTHASAPAMMPYENIQIQLIDTPPITADYFEFWQAEQIKNADAALIVIDASAPEPGLDYMALLEKLEERRIRLASDPSDDPSDDDVFRKRCLILANKMDLPQASRGLGEIEEVLEPGMRVLPISTLSADGLEPLKSRIFQLLDVLRVYSKTPGKKPSMDEPFIFRRGSTLMDMARSVHRDFASKLKYARIWGGKKYQGQKVNRDYILQDEDIIELHI
jgi:ribosome-interacting GTPase 1